MQVYFIKREDEEGKVVYLPDTDGVTIVKDNGQVISVPNEPKNRHWQEYLEWKAEDPENNVPQTEA